MAEPITRALGFDVYTLPSYSTPYYFCRELGSANHFQTVRRLENAIKRAIKAGKLTARESK